MSLSPDRSPSGGLEQFPDELGLAMQAFPLLRPLFELNSQMNNAEFMDRFSKALELSREALGPILCSEEWAGLYRVGAFGNQYEYFMDEDFKVLIAALGYVGSEMGGGKVSDHIDTFIRGAEFNKLLEASVQLILWEEEDGVMVERGDMLLSEIEAENERVFHTGVAKVMVNTLLPLGKKVQERTINAEIQRLLSIAATAESSEPEPITLKGIIKTLGFKLPEEQQSPENIEQREMLFQVSSEEVGESPSPIELLYLAVPMQTDAERIDFLVQTWRSAGDIMEISSGGKGYLNDIEFYGGPIEWSEEMALFIWSIYDYLDNEVDEELSKKTKELMAEPWFIQFVTEVLKGDKKFGEEEMEFVGETMLMIETAYELLEGKMQVQESDNGLSVEMQIMEIDDDGEVHLDILAEMVEDFPVLSTVIHLYKAENEFEYKNEMMKLMEMANAVLKHDMWEEGLRQVVSPDCQPWSVPAVIAEICMAAGYEYARAELPEARNLLTRALVLDERFLKHALNLQEVPYEARKRFQANVADLISAGSNLSLYDLKALDEDAFSEAFIEGIEIFREHPIGLRSIDELLVRVEEASIGSSDQQEGSAKMDQLSVIFVLYGDSFYDFRAN